MSLGAVRERRMPDATLEPRHRLEGRLTLSQEECGPTWWARLLLMYVWLAALGVVTTGIADGTDRPAWLAAATLVGFVALYVTATWLAVAHAALARARLLALAGLAALTLAATIHFSEVWFLLFVYLSAACAVCLPSRWALAGVVAVTAGAGLVAVEKAMPASVVLPWLIGPFFGGLVNVYFLRTQRLIADLRMTREELARVAVQEERLRLARDLHDLLGHSLSLIVVKAEVVRRLAERDPAAAARQAADIEAVGREALAEVREVVTGYRQRGLAAEIEGARDALADAGIDLAVHGDDTPLPPAVDALFGWVLREGATNVIRHSGARHCSVDISRDDGQAVLRIRDDGARGARVQVPPSRGSGLRGLAERVGGAGGRLDAGSCPDGGFRLSATVPLNGANGRAREDEA